MREGLQGSQGWESCLSSSWVVRRPVADSELGQPGPQGDSMKIKKSWLNIGNFPPFPFTLHQTHFQTVPKQILLIGC